MVSAEERIKRQLAQELHDQVAQTLTTMLVEMEQFKGAQAGRQSVLREVDALQGSTREVLHNIRQMLYQLRGEPGVDEDFPETVRTGLLRSFEDRSGMTVKFSVSPSWPAVISATASLNLYRILQEALANARAHSGAENVEVALNRDGEQVLLRVTDDGRGMPGGARDGMGIKGMRERALFLGGDLNVLPTAGPGTIVEARFQLEQLL